MARAPSPLLGFNTNIRHKGKVYHVQTEDSGVGKPHVITHLFADGGRIVDSRKASYAENLSAPNLQELVKKLMQDQHKGMCIALRDGKYDGDAPLAAPAPAATQKRASLPPPAGRVSKAPGASKRASLPPPAAGSARHTSHKAVALDLAALDRAAEARIAESPITRASKRRAKGAEAPARKVPEPAPRTAAKPIRGKTLDDVIRSYLQDEGRKTGR